MKKTTTIALAFAALAGLAGTAAYADDGRYRGGHGYGHGYGHGGWHDGGRHMGMDRRGDGPGWHRREGGPGMRGDGPRRGMRGDGPGGRMFGRADTDNSGDISLEEFSAVMGGRILGADADGNGELTVGEVADAIIRMRAERRAQRMIERLDMDGDGKLTTAEIENRQKKIFALMDRNDDGKVDRDEIARSRRDHGGWHRGGGWGHHRGWGMMGNSGAGMNDDGDSPAGDGMMEEDGSE